MSNDSVDQGRPSWIAYTLAIAGLAVSAAWFLFSPDYEPLLAILSACGVLGAIIARHRDFGRGFGIGFVAGVLVTALVTIASVSRRPHQANSVGRGLRTATAVDATTMGPGLPRATTTNDSGTENVTDHSTESPLGVARPIKLPIYDARASSNSDKARAMLDGQDSTSSFDYAWFSRRGELGGAWFELLLPEAHVVTELRIFMRVSESWACAQIRDAEITTAAGGQPQRVRFPFATGWHPIAVKPAKTDWVRVKVLDVYPAGECNQLQIFEVELHGHS